MFTLAPGSEAKGGLETHTAVEQTRAPARGDGRAALAVCPGNRGHFPGRWMWCLLDLWTADPPCSVARVGKSKPRQTTTRSASDNVFPDLSAVFIDQAAGAADLEKNAVPEQVSCRKESCTAWPGHSS